MSLFSREGSSPVAGGQCAPAGSLSDLDLAQLLRYYKRSVASAYRALTPDEIPTLIPKGRLWVSPKLDGELWFLVLDPDEPFLTNPKGKVLYGRLPFLEEARRMAPRADGRAIVAGELYAIPKAGLRPRVGDVSRALGEEVERIRFAGFDLVIGATAGREEAPTSYGERIDEVRRLLEGGEVIAPVTTELGEGPADVARRYEEWAGGGRGEGLVVRSEDGRTFKVKPAIDIDACVIGYTVRTEDAAQCRSFLLAVMREPGQFQVLGSVGNLGTEDDRRSLLARVTGTEAASNYRMASTSGALYRFVRPDLVVTTKVTDIQSENAVGDPVRRMVLSFDGEIWSALKLMPGVSILHPVFVRVRDDKRVDEVDVRIDQVLDRVVVESAHEHVEALDLPESEVIRREVYVKPSKGSTAVRKVLVWRTNKETQDERYPAYVVHYTDYSDGRKEPLQRTVRPAPDAEVAATLADDLVAANVLDKNGKPKRGWKRLDG